MLKKQPLVYKNTHRKKIITLLIVLSAFNSIAQRTMFGAQNNYVAPAGPSLPVLVTTAVTAITGTTATH